MVPHRGNEQRLSLCIDQELFHKHLVESKKQARVFQNGQMPVIESYKKPDLNLLPRSTYTCHTYVITGTGILNTKFTRMFTPGEEHTERNQRKMQMSP